MLRIAWTEACSGVKNKAWRHKRILLRMFRQRYSVSKDLVQKQTKDTIGGIDAA
jgi:hypothetical protein